MKLFLLLLIGAFLHSADAMEIEHTKKKKGSKLAKIFKVLTLGFVAQIASNSPNNFVCQDVSCVDENYFLNASKEYLKLHVCPPLPKNAELLMIPIICHEKQEDFTGRKYLQDLPDMIHDGGVDKCPEQFKLYWKTKWSNEECSKMPPISRSIYAAAKLGMFGKEPSKKLERQMIKDDLVLAQALFRQPMTREIQKEKFEDFLSDENIEGNAALKLAEQFDDIEADFYQVLLHVHKIQRLNKERGSPVDIPSQKAVKHALEEYWDFQKFNENQKQKEAENQKQKEASFNPEKIHEDEKIYF